MSKPLPTSHPMFRMIEKQLYDAIISDGPRLRRTQELGINARAVLAEILGKAVTHEPAQCIDHSKNVGVPATDTVDISGLNPFSGPLQYMPAAYAKLETELREAHAEIERLTGIIHTPEIDYFMKGVNTEAEYQREIHKDSDADKTPAQWVACITYLASKALQAIATGRIDKAKHHIVTTAACCKRWHSYAPEVQNDETGERPVQ